MMKGKAISMYISGKKNCHSDLSFKVLVDMIVASECSSKFAKIIGKGNPVAVLDTMILLSYAKLFNTLLASASLIYWGPAYGSRNVDISKSEHPLMI